MGARETSPGSVTAEREAMIFYLLFRSAARNPFPCTVVLDIQARSSSNMQVQMNSAIYHISYHANQVPYGVIVTILPSNNDGANICT